MENKIKYYEMFKDTETINSIEFNDDLSMVLIASAAAKIVDACMDVDQLDLGKLKCYEDASFAILFFSNVDFVDEEGQISAPDFLMRYGGLENLVSNVLKPLGKYDPATTMAYFNKYRELVDIYAKEVQRKQTMDYSLSLMVDYLKDDADKIVSLLAGAFENIDTDKVLEVITPLVSKINGVIEAYATPTNVAKTVKLLSSLKNKG